MSQEAFEKLLKDNYQPTTHEEFLILLYRRIFEHEKRLVRQESELEKTQKYHRKKPNVGEYQKSAEKNRTNTQHGNSQSYSSASTNHQNS
jgi:hypothetical protein